MNSVEVVTLATNVNAIFIAYRIYDYANIVRLPT